MAAACSNYLGNPVIVLYHSAAPVVGWNAPQSVDAAVLRMRRERAARQANEKRFSLASDSRENHRLRNMFICRNVCELGMGADSTISILY